jgi:hypothetical protein
MDCADAPMLALIAVTVGDMKALRQLERRSLIASILEFNRSGVEFAGTSQNFRWADRAPLTAVTFWRSCDVGPHREHPEAGSVNVQLERVVSLLR